MAGGQRVAVAGAEPALWLAAATVPDDKRLLQRQIEATDRQIDGLVYELYELSPDEIRIVEEATAS